MTTRRWTRNMLEMIIFVCGKIQLVIQKCHLYPAFGNLVCCKVRLTLLWELHFILYRISVFILIYKTTLQREWWANMTKYAKLLPRLLISLALCQIANAIQANICVQGNLVTQCTPFFLQICLKWFSDLFLYSEGCSCSEWSWSWGSQVFPPEHSHTFGILFPLL